MVFAIFIGLGLGVTGGLLVRPALHPRIFFPRIE